MINGIWIMKRTSDIRVIRTQKSLLEALEVLIRAKKLSCISITELCSEAGINRNTFYYHYNNIYELLDEHKQLMINEMNSVLDDQKTPSKETLINLCKCIRRHPVFLNILLSPNCDIDYFNDIFELAAKKTSVFVNPPRAITSKRDIMTCYYCNAGCNAVIRSWISSGMKESPEEIADIISQSSMKGPITVLFPSA